MNSTAIARDDRRHARCAASIETLERTVIGQGHILRSGDEMAKELEGLIELVRAHRTIRPTCPTMMPTQSAEMALREYRRRRGPA